MRKCWKIEYRRTGHRSQYGAFALHAGYLKIHTHKHSECGKRLLSHCNNGYMNAPQCYVTLSLPILFLLAYECDVHDVLKWVWFGLSETGNSAVLEWDSQSGMKSITLPNCIYYFIGQSSVRISRLLAAVLPQNLCSLHLCFNSPITLNPQSKALTNFDLSITGVMSFKLPFIHCSTWACLFCRSG